MKSQLLFFLLFLNISAFAQTDTTIYQVVEEMPRFPGCEELEGTTAEKSIVRIRKCWNIFIRI